MTEVRRSPRVRADDHVLRIPSQTTVMLPRVLVTPTRTPARHRAPTRKSVKAELVAALAGLAVLSWSALLFPYRGDNAVFAMMGRQILHGEVLYKQLWDVKQPGIFLWYGAADLLGIGERGSRALDVLAALALGVLVAMLLRTRIRTPWVRRWVPALVPAAAMLGAGPGDIGQLEMICLVPALGAFVLVAASPQVVPSYARLAGAGLCLGIVSVFKLPLAGVPALAIVAYLAIALRRERVLSVAVVTVFAIVPLGLTLAWLAAQGAFDDTLRTWTVDAADMGNAPGTRSLPRLLEGFGRYCVFMAPATLLAGWQVVAALRRSGLPRSGLRRSGSSRRDPLDIAMVVWLALNIAAISAQFGWWYQWYFLTAPLLVLAVRRLDVLATRLSGAAPLRRTVAVTLLGLACLPLLAHGGYAVGGLVLDGGGFTAASRARYDDRLADYGTVRDEIAAIGMTQRDTLFVLGNPLYHYLGGQPLVVRTDSWGYDLMAAWQWREMAAELHAARPTLVLVQPDTLSWIADRGGDITRILDSDYTVARTSSEGTWYRLRSSG